MKLKLERKHLFIAVGLIFGVLVLVLLLYLIFRETPPSPLEEKRKLISSLEAEEETLKKQVIEAHKLAAKKDAVPDAFLDGKIYEPPLLT